MSWKISSARQHLSCMSPVEERPVLAPALGRALSGHYPSPDCCLWIVDDDDDDDADDHDGC